jgi:hypothetical protein
MRNYIVIFYKMLTVALVATPLIATYELFYPVYLCVREWGGMTRYCRETLELTLWVPTLIFGFFWMLLLVVFLIARRLKNRSAATRDT